jgi:hypothetical protein
LSGRRGEEDCCEVGFKIRESRNGPANIEGSINLAREAGEFVPGPLGFIYSGPLKYLEAPQEQIFFEDLTELAQ